MNKAMNASKTALFRRFVELLEEHAVRYALLGQTDGYPASIGSDVDVMVHPDDIAKVHQLVWKIEDASIRVVQMLQHEPVAFFYVVVRFEVDGVCILQPDICTDYYRNGVKLLSAEELLQDTVYAIDEAGRSKRFRILASEKEFIYYLLKKIDKGAIDEVQFGHLRAQFLKHPEGASAQVRRFWSEKSLESIQKTFEANNLSEMQREFPLLRHELHGSFSFSLKDAFKRFLLRVRRCLNPTGFVIQIEQGDDSSGTLAKDLFELLGGAFRRQYHIDLSKTGRLAWLALPTRVLKARICSTLVILLGMRKPWLAHVDARITPHEGKAQVVLSGRRSREGVVANPESAQTSLELAQRLLEALAQRTRSRCLRLCREAPPT